MKLVTPYPNALIYLKKTVKEFEPSFLDHEECDACLTHLLHDKSIKPPFLPESIWEYFSEYKQQKEIADAEQYRICNTEQLFFPFVYDDIPYPPPQNPKFTFIDLFAGIGGFRLAMQAHEGKCVFSSEWDKYAKKTYEANYGEVPYGDIKKIDENDIPDHDILCAGFPCQPFSLAGVSKKNSLGRKHGFEDKTQGTIFFDVARIIKAKRPKAFFLENVKNLFRHNKGETFSIIRETLEKELDYVLNFKVVDGAAWVPQHRERLFIVGFDKNRYPDFEPADIIIPNRPDPEYKYPELGSIISNKVDPKYTLGQGTWNTLIRHKAHHANSGNGFGYGIHKMPVKKGEITRTISARYHKDGAEVLIEQSGSRPRKLTVKEAMQLQGYDPNCFKLEEVVSNTQAYKQIGNSVVVPAITAVAGKIIDLMLLNNCSTKEREACAM